jgi:hypothetical protein
MKVRLGFVSNSSSCSFLITGICLEEITQEQANMVEESAKEQGFKYDEVKITTGSLEWCGETGHLYVGLDYSTMKDEETKLEFKARAQKICDTVCDKIGVPHQKCGQYKDAWRND